MAVEGTGLGGTGQAVARVQDAGRVEAGSPLFLDMIDDARLLHDTDGFFRRYLDGFRPRLQVLGSRRIWLGNAWYWELKPKLSRQ